MLTRFRCSPHQPPFLPSSFPPTTQYNDIQQKLSRFHTLSATSPDRKGLAREMDADCDSIKYQVSITSGGGEEEGRRGACMRRAGTRHACAWRAQAAHGEMDADCDSIKYQVSITSGGGGEAGRMHAQGGDKVAAHGEMDADCDSIKYQVSLTREEVGGAWHAHEGNGAP